MNRWLCICAAFALPFTGALAQTAHSLDQVPSLLKTPEARNNFTTQIEGKTPPDRLGLKLPPGLSAQQITSLLLPAGNTGKLNSVGAKAWPGQPDHYVAIVCTGGDIPTRPDDTPCAKSADDTKTVPLHVYVGVIEAKPDTAPRVAAKAIELNGMVDWHNTDLPSAPDALDDASGDTISPDNYSGFDLAPYRIAADQPAFGLRGEWSVMYSGGGGDWTALYLFSVVDGALRQVLAVPMSSFKDIAGDWNKDGTRQHDISDMGNVLVVTPHVTDSHFDLLVKRRDGRKAQTYRWSATAAGYQPAGK